MSGARNVAPECASMLAASPGTSTAACKTARGQRSLTIPDGEAAEEAFRRSHFASTVGSTGNVHRKPPPSFSLPHDSVSVVQYVLCLHHMMSASKDGKDGKDGDNRFMNAVRFPGRRKPPGKTSD